MRIDAATARREVDAMLNDDATVAEFKKYFNNDQIICRPKASKFTKREVKFRQKQFKAKTFSDDELNVTIKEMINKGYGIVMGSKGFIAVKQNENALAAPVYEKFTVKQLAVYDEIKRSGKNRIAVRGEYGTAELETVKL